MVAVGDRVKVRETYAGPHKAAVGRVYGVRSVNSLGDVVTDGSFYVSSSYYGKNRPLVLKHGEYEVTLTAPTTIDLKDVRGQKINIGDHVAVSVSDGGLRVGEVVAVKQYTTEWLTKGYPKICVEVDSTKGYSDSQRTVVVPVKVKRWFAGPSRMVVLNEKAPVTIAPNSQRIWYGMDPIKTL